MRLALVALLSVLSSSCSCATTHERVPDADAGNDGAIIVRDATATPDAFVARDAFAATDGFVASDAFMATDAFVATDAGSSDAGVPIDGAMCSFVGSFLEQPQGFVTTMRADGTWETADPSGTTIGGTYTRTGDTITYTGDGCSATYTFVGNGCDAFTLVFLSSGCGAGSNLTYVRTS